MSARSFLRLVVACMAALLTAVVAAPPGASQTDGDLRDIQRELERVRGERAQKAAEVDVLQADEAAVRQVLADLEANVKDQAAALASAQRKEEEAVAMADAAKAAVEATAAQLVAAEATASQVARQAYMDQGASGPLDLLSASDLNAAAYRDGMLATQSRSFDDAIDELGAARQDLELRQQAAEEAERHASERREETADQLASLEAAQAAQQQKATEIEARLEAALAEAQALSDTDAQLSAQIEQEQAEIAAALAALQAQAAAGAAVRGPVPGAPVTAIDAGSGASPTGDVALATIGEVTVAAEIAGQVEALLNDAAAQGIVLGGGGYRSSQRQVELRISHCGGSSEYAIYQRPASQCRPPTARPGQSQHERGLAIDFTCNGGGTIRSRSSPCFQWLAANAANYGLHNLPSEPWHWSVNGK